jgi:dCMP deaminase
MSDELRVGDLVQFTLEEAVKMEMYDTLDDFDPFNEVFKITLVMNSHNVSMSGVSRKTCVVNVDPKTLIKVNGTPRVIERAVEERQSKDEYYLDIAKQVASRSTCLRRKYGALIVRNDVIVSAGYNGSPRDGHNCSDKGICVRQVMNMAHNSGNYDLCRSVHAEQNAIINAARQGTSLLGGTLYLYGYDCVQKKAIDAEPCPICSRMIENAGLARTVRYRVLEDEENTV